jgi:hypothetical protein
MIDWVAMNVTISPARNINAVRRGQCRRGGRPSM